MQNRYAGDVGDFGKFGLLRILLAAPLRPGVVWYLFPDETNTDGGFTAYPRLRHCDPLLFDALQRVVASGRRNVMALQRASVVPGAVYFAEELSFAPRTPRSERERRRRAWLDAALEATASCDVVFVDPDNGIETPSTSLYAGKGPKFVGLDELGAFSERGQSLVVYHHLNRHALHGSHAAQLRSGLRRLRERCGGRAIGLRYRRGGSRAFFVVVQEEHEAVLLPRIESFMRSPWGEHFERTG